MILRGRTALAVCLVASGIVLVGTPSKACANEHVGITLGSFPPEALSRPFYWTEESSGSVSFVIRAYDFSDACIPSSASVAYETADDTAMTITDYIPATGRTAVLTDPRHTGNDAQPVPVTLVDDVVPEAPVEIIDVSLSAPQGGRLLDPTLAYLYVVDDDALMTEVSLDGADYEQSEFYGDTRGGVPVFRGGPATAPTTVRYEIRPGPAPAARPNKDFQAFATGSVRFEPSQRVALIPLTIKNDLEAEPDEKLTVTLTGADGATVLDPSTMKFTILDNEERVPPASRLHHPRQNLRYTPDDYRIREIHVFTDDEAEPGSVVSGTIESNLGLRKNLIDGSCEWWSGNAWVARGCSKILWLKMRLDDPDFFIYRLGKNVLTPSVGTEIRNYTGYSRAIDGAGNKERKLEKARNYNTFEVKPKR
ncbi:MAG: Calx-beta domain-containing protein [Actinomycetota bacterium]